MPHHPPAQHSPHPRFTPEDWSVLLARANAARDNLRRLTAQLADARHRLDRQVTVTPELLDLTERTRASARMYAAYLKHDGLPPERMVIELKTAVRTSRLRASISADGVLHDVVQWAIEGYYAA